MKNTDTGWVITNEDNSDFYEFTFARTRTESIKKWNNLWENKNWKSHYRSGHRCIKCVRSITTI